MKLTKTIFATLVLMIWGTALFSQISQGGTPHSFKKTLKSKIPVVYMDYVDNYQLMEDAKKESKESGPFKFGHEFEVNLNLENSGIWEILENGDHIWRLNIKSFDALSINLIYDDFVIPEGGNLFIYSEDGSQILGAFTSENNKDLGEFATGIVIGDSIILEYYEPFIKIGQGKICISKVIHGFRNILESLTQPPDNESESCEININCSDGSDWQTIKKAVVLIVMGNATCTGCLINNARNDGTPYLLTAHHCMAGSDGGDPANWTFYFGWESPQCDPTENPASYHSIAGAEIVSNWWETDFKLLKLNSKPQDNYDVYYAGWDRQDSKPTAATCIHHPLGDVKKISTCSTGSNISKDWTHSPWFANGEFIEVTFDSGTVEPGSSGSPLFNQNKKIVGQCWGNSKLIEGNVDENCADGFRKGLFGELNMSWEGNGTSSSRLRDWLDPDNTGINTLGGYKPPIIIEGEITFDSPDANDVWRIGSGHEIEYTMPKNFPGGDLMFRLHGPVSGIVRNVIDSEWKPELVDPNNPSTQNGDWKWNINTLLDGTPIEPGSGYQIELISWENYSINGVSPPFTIGDMIITPTIEMTSPNGGETLTLGESFTFTWSSTVFPESENIGLKIVKNDVDLGYIAENIPNTGSYAMTLSTLTGGQAIEPGNDYKIAVRVMDTGNGVFEDRSDQNFTILADESICAETWRTANSPITTQINDLIFVNDGFMAAAGGRIILTSVNGINWDFIDTGVDGNNLAITYGNNQYVVSGTDGLILTSPDGTTWTPQTSGVSVKLRDVIWANSLYIAVGLEGMILTSPDGITWTQRTSGTINRLAGISYGNATYVVVGLDGIILTSPDGITWSEVNSGTTNTLTGVVYTNGQFLAVGIGGTIITSSDGTNWTGQTSGTTEILFGIEYELSRYVVTGNAGTVLTSPDGTTWTAQDPGITTDLLWGIAYGNGKFVAAGVGGTILYSECPGANPPVISVMSPNGGEDLGLGSTYTVTWNAVNITGNIKINLYKGGQWYGNIVRDIPAAQGSYNWEVGSLSNGETALEGTDYKILVRTMDNGPYDLSDGNFTINNDPTIEILSPNGGETFYRHNNLTVSWVSNQTENVNINLLQNGTALGRIASNIADSGSYTWEIEQLENNVIPDYASNYQVQIETVSGTLDDTSETNFTIAKPFITFQKPQEGNTYAYGSKIYINWTTTGIDKGSITLYMNRYTSTETYKIATYLFDKGTTTYTVGTSIPADYYKIKGIWTVDSSVYSKSGKFLVTE